MPALPPISDIGCDNGNLRARSGPWSAPDLDHSLISSEFNAVTNSERLRLLGLVPETLRLKVWLLSGSFFAKKSTRSPVPLLYPAHRLNVS